MCSSEMWPFWYVVILLMAVLVGCYSYVKGSVGRFCGQNMEITEICGLKGIGAGTKRQRLISLENKKQVLIGRRTDCDVVIESPMISRLHAIIKEVNGCWTITDNKSANGITVNGKALEPLQAHCLKDLDVIQLGVPCVRDKPADFVWVFKKKIKVKAIRCCHRKDDDDKFSKKKVDDERRNQQEKSSSSTVKRKSLDEENFHLCKKPTRTSDSSEVLQSTTEPNAVRQCSQELNKREEKLVNEVKNGCEEKRSLEEIIAQQELCNRMLEQELSKARAENKRQQEMVSEMKKEILSDFTELVESGLECSICTELFVKATTLNCSHSYCAMCIEKWMRVKKFCPSCRAPVTSSIRSIVLDSYIDAVVERLSEEMKTRRMELIKERTALELEMKEAKAKRCNSRRNRHRGRTRQSTMRNSRNIRMRLPSAEDQSEEIPGTPRMATRSQSRIRGDQVPQHTNGDNTNEDNS